MKIYTPTKSNWIFFAITAGVSLLIFELKNDSDSYSIGYQFGTVLAFILFPYLIGISIWLVAERKRSAGSIAFNIILSILIIGQVVGSGQKRIQNEKLNDMVAAKDELKGIFEEVENPNTAYDAYNKYEKKIEKGFNELIENATGSDKEVYQALSIFSDQRRLITEKWQSLYLKLQSDEILNYESLNTDEEYQYQIGVLNDFIAANKAYQNFFTENLPKLEKTLATFKHNKIAQGALKGARDKQKNHIPVFLKYTGACHSYAEGMIETLELLYTNRDKWELHDDGLDFKNNELGNQFNRIIEDLTKIESSINSLNTKLLETM